MILKEFENKSSKNKFFIKGDKHHGNTRFVAIHFSSFLNLKPISRNSHQIEKNQDSNLDSPGQRSNLFKLKKFERIHSILSLTDQGSHSNQSCNSKLQLALCDRWLRTKACRNDCLIPVSSRSMPSKTETLKIASIH